MNKIEVMPDNLINKIAAGEVVDRPFSIVKELVENSIDAGSDNIMIIIKDGGKSLIEIIDDGIGMDEDDLILSFERHATSKVRSFNDLEHIGTMGFRGEALPSIASVSIVEASSKLKGSEDGHIIKINGGVISDVKPVPMQKSTSIRIKSLFYNLPARRKFLKEPAKEYRFIYSYFKKVAVSRPDIGFTFINDDRTVFQLKKESLSERICNIFREVEDESLIEINSSLMGYNIKGYIGKKEISRKSKDNQYLFVNNRIVENKMISYAVYQSYKNLIEPGYYPFFILFIDMPPEKVDVNVHPSKMEIKFHEEGTVRSLVKDAVFNTLSGQGSLVSYRFDENKNLENSSIHSGNAKFINKAFDNLPKTEDPIVERVVQDSLFEDKIDNLLYKINSPENSMETAEVNEAGRDANKISEREKFMRPSTKGVDILKFGKDSVVTENVWQFQNKYIFIELDSGMAIIDQHVAQERIFFEQAMNCFKNVKLDSQVLLFPVKVELSLEDKEVVDAIRDHLIQIGFMISEFGGNTFIIEGTPLKVKVGEEKQELLDILDYYKNYREKKMGVNEAVAASYACKKAIKAGQSLTKDEMLSLINDLFLCEFPHVCPHGRPVIINMSVKELDKRFGRT